MKNLRIFFVLSILVILSACISQSPESGAGKVVGKPVLQFTENDSVVFYHIPVTGLTDSRNPKMIVSYKTKQKLAYLDSLEGKIITYKILRDAKFNPTYQFYKQSHKDSVVGANYPSYNEEVFLLTSIITQKNKK